MGFAKLRELSLAIGRHRNFGTGVKISKEGTPDALFQECLSDIYRRRAEADNFGVETRESPEIAELTANEVRITREIFKRVDPHRELVPRLENGEDQIDPFWDPFSSVSRLKSQVAAQFHDLARFWTSYEARQHRRTIREAWNRINESADPYAKPTANSTQDYKYRSERFWDPDVNQRLVLNNNKRPFCWRDLHVLHNFVAENGQILPRRLTFATRKQQRQIFKAIKQSRQMALFPYDWRPRNQDRIPLMDPKQYLADELYFRYRKLGDLRAKALIHVLMQRGGVNCFRYDIE